MGKFEMCEVGGGGGRKGESSVSGGGQQVVDINDVQCTIQVYCIT